VVDHESPRRVWAARLIAPLAFFGAATIFIILIQAGLNGGSSEAATTTSVPTVSAPTTTAASTNTNTNTGPRKKKFYRVKSGDTLESIAAKFNTTVDDLLALNPTVDPLALSPNEKLRVS
jgi:LysM repeat protein